MKQATKTADLNPPAGMEVLVVGLGWWGRGATAAKALQQAPSWRNGPAQVWYVPPGAYIGGMGEINFKREFVGTDKHPREVAKGEVSANRRFLKSIEPVDPE